MQIILLPPGPLVEEGPAAIFAVAAIHDDLPLARRALARVAANTALWHMAKTVETEHQKGQPFSHPVISGVFKLAHSGFLGSMPKKLFLRIPPAALYRYNRLLETALGPASSMTGVWASDGMDRDTFADRWVRLA